MDPLSIAAIGYAIEKAGGKELLIRIFGPLADQIGEKIKNSSNYLINNTLNKLAQFTNKKINTHKINIKNNVQLSIAHEILNEAIFQDGDIFLEYYSGVIAASRANQNDIGKEICQIISRLSSYSLRLHYIIYNVLRNTFLNKNTKRYGFEWGWN